jgi:protein TonB
MSGNFKDIPDFDDIVFEHRNKEYGAYQLRKKYIRAVIAGFIISSLFAVLVVVVPFVLYFNSEEKSSENLLYYYSVQVDNLEPPIDIFVPPMPLPPPPPRGSIVVQEVVRYAPPVVIDSILPAEETFAAVDEILLQTTIENSIFDGIGTGTGDDIIYGYGYGFGDGDLGDAFFFVEVMPSFRGGDINTFREWVQRRIIYPQAAMQARIQGTVYFTFIVEQDGSVSNVTVVKGVAPIIDDIVVSAIESSPNWSPGLQRGQPVRMRYIMALNFVL